MVKLQKFQTVTFDGWSTEITKKNHIDSLYGKCPQMVANFMIQLLSRNFGNSLETVLSKYPIKEFEDDTEYMWDVIGSARRNIPLVEARDYTGKTIDTEYTEMVGVGGEHFYLVFAEHWFFDGEEIFGELNQVYPMLIKGKPVQEGTNYVYEVELSNGSQKGIPAERLLPGERFSYAFAPVERGLSKEVGGVRYTTPSKMRNEFTTIRIHDEASGDVFNQKIAFGVPVLKTENGKQIKTTANMWMHMWEYTFEQTWREYKNNLYAWSVSNRNENGDYMNFGKSGEVIRKGDGLFAQMERGNVFYFNKFSLKYLESILLAISTTKIAPGERSFLVRTGDWGAVDFSKAVASEASGWTMFTYNGDALGVIKRNGEGTYTAVNPQFTEYIGPMGLRVKVEVDEFYNDPVNNKIDYPNGEGKAMSHRMDIFYEGSMGQPNIFKCGIKGQPTEGRSYQWGIRNPYTGTWDNPNMSYTDDKASVHRMGQFGVCVLDPTRVVSLIPQILKA
jgi:hypothetical protein